MRAACHARRQSLTVSWGGPTNPAAGDEHGQRRRPEVLLGVLDGV
jgi:hypothetical protein